MILKLNLAVFSVLMALALTTPAFAQELTPGSMVELNTVLRKNGIPSWEKGRVLKYQEPFYTIGVTPGPGRPTYEYLVTKEQVVEFVRPVGAESPAVKKTAISAQASSPVASHTVPVKPTHPAGAPAQSIADQTFTGQHPQAKGMPPSGLYKCSILAGSSLQGLPSLEIQGGTYRGLGQSGAFAPFNLNGGDIHWSAGIKGLPDGARIRNSVYSGLDYRGRPMIKIYYRSANNFNQCIECIKQ